MSAPGAVDAKRLTREDWVRAARDALVASGHSRVKVDRLADDLGVTRGSFYWHFKSREALLAAILEDWTATNSGVLLHALAKPGTLRERLGRIVRIWIEELGFSPAYDAAMREWARASPLVAAAVAEADKRRIHAFIAAFSEAGFPADEALIRGRVTYFHQVGYYTIGMRESRRARLRNADLYLRVLIGEAG